MSLDTIGLRPLTIIAGKGGVGRSTLAAAYARTAADDGARVLAVDVVADGGLRRALAAADPGPQKGEPIEVLELSTERALEEYIDLYLRLPIAPSRLGPIAAIFDYVATAAPGVREILTIGKIAYEAKEGPWDVVVVDGPATGHCIELLAAPETLNELVGFGPLVDQTEWMETLLGDPAITGVIAVTLAEELPVSETLGLLDRLLAETHVDVAGLVVNQVPPILDASAMKEADRLVAAGGPIGEAAVIARTRSAVAAAQFDRLAPLELPTIDVAMSPDPLDEAMAALGAFR